MRKHQRITGEITATPIWKFKKPTWRQEVGFSVLVNLLDINEILVELITHNPKKVENCTV